MPNLASRLVVQIRQLLVGVMLNAKSGIQVSCADKEIKNE
jgi:hypothetical protein